jgi:hypothetical protein
VNSTATNAAIEENDERQPQKGENEEVRQSEQPLDEPKPTRGLPQLAFDSERVRRDY